MIDVDFGRSTQRDASFHTRINDRAREAQAEPGKVIRGSRIGWDSQEARSMRTRQHYLNSLPAQQEEAGYIAWMYAREGVDASEEGLYSRFTERQDEREMQPGQEVINPTEPI